MTPLAFIDTETTGVHPGRLAWEIAIIRRDDDGQEELLLQVDGIDLSNADPFGLNVGRFYQRHVNYAPAGTRHNPDVLVESEATVAEMVEDWTRGAHLVGAVPSFDAATLDPMLRRHGYLPAWHYHLIDVEALAVGWLAARQPGNLWGSPPWKSDDLTNAVQVLSDSDEPLIAPEDERHTALGDARWAMRLYDAIVGAA